VCRLVFTHAFAEEAVLWPALRRALPDGDQLTVRVEREHQEITEVVADLEQSRAGTPERDALIDRAITLLRDDARDEEDDLFPRLQPALSSDELRRLGRQWGIARGVAPTRSHPVVSRRPPGNVLAALPLSVIDRARDLLDEGARRTTGPVAAGGRGANRVLTSVARAIEWLPPFRQGEDPSTRFGRSDREN
jgi:hemerythrin superfamily protein